MHRDWLKQARQIHGKEVEHQHEDGTVHSHEDGDAPHEHAAEDAVEAPEAVVEAEEEVVEEIVEEIIEEAVEEVVEDLLVHGSIRLEGLGPETYRIKEGKGAWYIDSDRSLSPNQNN